MDSLRSWMLPPPKRGLQATNRWGRQVWWEASCALYHSLPLPLPHLSSMSPHLKTFWCVLKTPKSIYQPQPPLHKSYGISYIYDSKIDDMFKFRLFSWKAVEKKTLYFFADNDDAWMLSVLLRRSVPSMLTHELLCLSRRSSPKTTLCLLRF